MYSSMGSGYQIQWFQIIPIHSVSPSTSAATITIYNTYIIYMDWDFIQMNQIPFRISCFRSINLIRQNCDELENCSLVCWDFVLSFYHYEDCDTMGIKMKLQLWLFSLFFTANSNRAVHLLQFYSDFPLKERLVYKKYYISIRNASN